MLAALGLFLLIEVVGLLAAPLAAFVLGRLPGAGLGFSKVLGLLLVTWLIWMAASLGYGVEWADWESLKPRERRGLDGYYTEPPGWKRRDTCALRSVDGSPAPAADAADA